MFKTCVNIDHVPNCLPSAPPRPRAIALKCGYYRACFAEESIFYIASIVIITGAACFYLNRPLYICAREHLFE